MDGQGGREERESPGRTQRVHTFWPARACDICTLGHRLWVGGSECAAWGGRVLTTMRDL